MRYFIPVIGLILVGCASTTSIGPRDVPSGVTLFDPSLRYSPVAVDSVRIIIEISQIEDLNYDYLARIEEISRGGIFLMSGAASESELIERIRYKAGQVGANAILYPEFSVSGDGGYNTRRGTTVALRIHYNHQR